MILQHYKEKRPNCDYLCLVPHSIFEEQCKERKTKTSDDKLFEKRAFREFVDKLDSEPKKKAVFSGYSTGPRIAGVVYDKHLDKSMKDAQKRKSFLRTFQIEDNCQCQDKTGCKKDFCKNWKRILNKNKKEKDLVILYEGNILHVEVKNGHVDKYPDQHTHFYKFLCHNYPGLFSEFNHVPVLYRSSKEPAVRGCDSHIVVHGEDFDNWWERRNSLVRPGISTKAFNKLTTDLLLRHVIVLGTTATTHTPGNRKTCHFFHLRHYQYSLLFEQNPDLAVIYGGPQTGKSLAAELGLSFFRKEEDKNVVRLLISRNPEPDNIQDKARKKLFEMESVMEFSHPETEDEMFEVIRNKKQRIEGGGEMMICIDNFPYTEDSPRTLETLKEFGGGLKKFKLWIVVEGVDVEIVEGFQGFLFTK